MKNVLMFLFVLFIVQGCSVANKTLDKKVAKTTAVYSVAKDRYRANTQHFTIDEQVLVERGIDKINEAERQIRLISNNTTLSNIAGFSSFIHTWSEARGGYLLIRAVLDCKTLSDNDKALMNELHKHVSGVDKLVGKLHPSIENHKKYIEVAQSIASIIKIVRDVKR